MVVYNHLSIHRMMTSYWILATGFTVFFISALYFFFTVMIKKGIADPSKSKGNISSAVIYSFTGAMSPKKKESTYLHLPTYAAGMIFHIGTFLSFLWLIILVFNIRLNLILIYLSAAFIVLASICGVGILIKRISKNELRQLSNPDDYISNILVTAFQIITASTLYFQFPYSLLFVYAAVLFIYMPIGKLRHSIFFFTSRIHLGKYFGKRGVWPVK
jgi:hypothetical protein